MDKEQKNNRKQRMKAIFYILFLGVLSLVKSNYTIAQDSDSTINTIHNQQLWIDFYPHYYMNEKLEYFGDAGYRTTISETSWNRFYVRPSVKYHFNKKWEAHTGIGFFYVFDKIDINTFEIRPWQGVQWNWMGLKRLKIHHSAKLEERWTFFKGQTDFEFRGRYKLFGKLILNEKWAIPAYGEIFIPLEGEVVELYRNKGRAGVGLSYKANKEWVLSFLFNWQGSRTGLNENLDANDYVYQIKIKKVWHNWIKTKHNRSKQ